MHEGFNLLSISSGGDVEHYSLKIFLKLIGRMEMTNGIIGQMEGVKTEGKVELDHEKMNLLKSKLML